MKVTIIHGQSHRGSTCNIARILAKKLSSEYEEFFLPRDFREFCLGCCTCFEESETKCPHYEKLLPLTNSIDNADIVILASPVYVYHSTGAMKAFLDHYGWRWMVHRPEEKMFSKQAVCISTAAGAGMNSAIKDMADSAFFWGIAKTYKYGIAVREVSWENVSSKRKNKIEKDIETLAKKITSKEKNLKPSLKTKFFFSIMCKMQKNGFNEADKKYWKAKGWTENKRPWKK